MSSIGGWFLLFGIAQCSSVTLIAATTPSNPLQKTDVFRLGWMETDLPLVFGRLVYNV